jgi:hypothetical protein
VDASEASVEPGEALCAGSVASVWYRFTPSRNMSVKAQANDSITYRTVALSVYTGAALDALTLVTCGTQLPGGYYAPQLVSFDATGGTTYYIRAGDFSGQLGTFTLDVQEIVRPANDNRSNAQPVGDLPALVSGDNTYATMEPGEQRPCGGDAGSVWYSVTTATARDLWLTPSNVQVGVYDAAGNHIGCGGFRTVAGATYLIQLVGNSFSLGSYSLGVTPYTPITGSVSVDSSAKIDRFGRVTVTGSIRCTGDFGVGFSLFVHLQQKIAKQPEAAGDGFAELQLNVPFCDGQAHAWTATASSQTASAFWTGSLTATAFVTILTDPYYFAVSFTGQPTKVSAQRVK